MTTVRALYPPPANDRTASGLPVCDLLYWADRDPPARSFLVPDLIPIGAVTGLYGDGGAGKTMLALDLAVAMATGGQWLGMPVAGCCTVGLFAEDDEPELVRRLKRICAVRGSELGAVAGLIHPLPFVGLDPCLAYFDGLTGELIETPLFASIFEHAKAEHASLLVLDYVAAVFGGSEIDRAQVQAFLRRLNAKAEAYGLAVLLLGHPSAEGMKSRGTSGSTAWRNQCRSFLHLTVDEVQDDGENRSRLLTLRHTKSNVGPVGAVFPLAFDGTEFAVQDGRRPANRPPRLPASVEVALSALRRAVAVEAVPSPGGEVPAGASCARLSLWREYAYSAGISPAGTAEANKRSFHRAQQELQARGVVGVVGPLAFILEAQ